MNPLIRLKSALFRLYLSIISIYSKYMNSPKVTLDQWRALQAVIDHGGFAQAAEKLHRSQSSVSYAVNRLQELLG